MPKFYFICVVAVDLIHQKLSQSTLQLCKKMSESVNMLCKLNEKTTTDLIEDSLLLTQQKWVSLTMDNSILDELPIEVSSNQD